MTNETDSRPLCKVCRDPYPAGHGLIAVIGKGKLGFGISFFRSEGFEAHTVEHQGICGKQCALKLVDEGLDRILDIRSTAHLGPDAPGESGDIAERQVEHSETPGGAIDEAA